MVCSAQRAVCFSLPSTQNRLRCPDVEAGEGARGPLVRAQQSACPPLADSSERGLGAGRGPAGGGLGRHELMVTWQLWFVGADGGGRSSPFLPRLGLSVASPAPRPPPPFCHITVSPRGLQQLLGSCPSLAPCSLPPCDSCPASTGPPAPHGQGWGDVFLLAQSP